MIDEVDNLPNIDPVSSAKQRTMEWTIKLVIIGEPRVGKTSLRKVYLGERFKSNYLPTLGADFSFQKVVMDGETYNITIWDLSGQPRYNKVHPQYYIGASGAIVVYDIESTENKEEIITKWIDNYIEYAGNFSGPILILQNKIDLINILDQTKISMKHKKLIKHINIYYDNKFPIFDGRTSAKTGENVQTEFSQFVQSVVEYQNNKLTNTSHSSSKTNLTEYIPAAYLIIFDEMLGPKIVTSSPPPTKMEFSDSELNSSIRVTSALNFNDLIQETSITGVSTWSHPVSLFYYIAFVIPNVDVRGGYSLNIIGVNVKREFKNIISISQNVVDGYLHKSMNEYMNFINSYDFDLSKDEDILALSIESDYKIDQILYKLRRSINQLIVANR